MTRALLVIDIQAEYFAGGLLPLWQAEEVEARVVAAIGQAQAAGDKVVLVRHVSAAPKGLFGAEGQGIAIRPAILAAAPEAPVVTKRVADAFQDTDLARHLEGVSELLVCGMMTQNCVVFTALSRDAERFAPCVIPELCTAPSETVHRIALSALGSKLALVPAAELWG